MGSGPSSFLSLFVICAVPFAFLGLWTLIEYSVTHWESRRLRRVLFGIEAVVAVTAFYNWFHGAWWFAAVETLLLAIFVVRFQVALSNWRKRLADIDAQEATDRATLPGSKWYSR